MAFSETEEKGIITLLQILVETDGNVLKVLENHRQRLAAIENHLQIDSGDDIFSTLEQQSNKIQ